MAVSAAPTPQPFRTRLSAFFYRHRWLKLALLLLPPLLWICVVYLGALAALLAHSLWTTNDLTQEVERTWSLDNFRTLWETDVYRTITLRTVGIAAAVTITDAILAFPLAYYMVRIASPRWRAIVFVGVLMPLWSSYLVRVYTWRLIMSDNGFANWTLEKLGFGSVDIAYSMWALWIAESYIWLPFMILPIYAALERIPPSLLEASADLGARGSAHLPAGDPAAGAARRRRRLDLHLLADPGRLHRYRRWSRTRSSSATSIYSNWGWPTTCPFAAAFAVVPDRRSWRSICHRPAPGRLRGAVGDGGTGNPDLTAAAALVLAFLCVPLLLIGALRVRRVHDPVLADHRVLDQVVVVRLAQHAHARRARGLGRGRRHGHRDRGLAGLAGGLRRRTASGSSAATPCR